MPIALRRGREPIFHLPLVVTIAVLVMIVIHVVRLALPETTDNLIVGLFAFAPDRYFGASDTLADTLGEPEWPGGLAAAIWSPFTYALLHADLIHLVSNGVVFAALGNLLARRMTAARFILFCVVTAPLSALGELAIAPWQSAPVIGASGVIAAMMGAFARIGFPSSDGETADMTISTVRETLRRPKVLQFMFAFALLNLLLVVAAPVLIGGGAGVAWMVHVAGFVAGFLLYPWFDGPARSPA